MGTLVLDTSTDHAVVAASRESGIETGLTTIEDRRHGRELVPMIQQAVARVKLSLSELTLIGIGLGPGSYTGLRIAVTAAKTLAYVSGAAVVGWDSLAAIAANAPTHECDVSVIADAQRGDLYVADFHRLTPHGPLSARGPSHVEPLDLWLVRRAPDTYVLGPALDNPRLRERLPSSLRLAPPELNRPNWRHMLSITQELFLSGQRFSVWDLEPNYLRRSSAEEKWEFTAAGLARAEPV